MFKAPLISALTISLLLIGCDFRPKHKVIEYQEEVKLSDDSMIWVDIKRHYRLVGEPFQKKGYLPSIVEISWDTGFPNVGRQSVFFDNHVFLIDKIDETWYVVGRKYPYNGQIDQSNSKNCRDIGSLLGQHCLITINEQGYFVSSNKKYILYSNVLKENLIWTTGLDDWQTQISHLLKNDSLYWQTKIGLKDRQSVETIYKIPE